MPHEYPNQRVRILPLQALQGAAHQPIRFDGAEELRVLHLAGQDHFADPLGDQEIQELRNFAQAQPVNGARQVGEFRRGFFLDAHDQWINALVPRGFQHQEGEVSVSRNDGISFIHARSSKLETGNLKMETQRSKGMVQSGYGQAASFGPSNFEFPLSSFEFRLLHHAALRGPNEFHEGPDVVRLEAGGIDSLQRLGGVQLGSAQQAEGSFQLLQVVGAQPRRSSPKRLAPRTFSGRGAEVFE